MKKVKWMAAAFVFVMLMCASFGVMAASFALPTMPKVENFSVMVGYEDGDILHRMMTITNVHTQSITLEQPRCKIGVFELGVLGKETLQPNESTTFAYAVKLNQPVGYYDEEIIVDVTCNGEKASVSRAISLTVEPYPYVEPAVLDFGTVSIDDTGVFRTFRLVNPSGKRLTVIPNGSWHFDCEPNYHGYPDLMPGASMEIPVYLKEPLEAGTFEEEFEMVFMGQGSGAISIPVKVTVTEPQTEEPDQQLTHLEGWLSFGAHRMEEFQPQSIIYQNTGTQPLVLRQPVGQYVDIGYLGTITLQPGQKVMYEVAPKKDLAVGSYEESISFAGPDSEWAQARVSFEVQQGTFALRAIPSVLDLGTRYEKLPNHGQPFPTQTITIQNVGTRSGYYTIDNYEELQDVFGIDERGPFYLAPGESATVNVTPPSVAPAGKIVKEMKISGPDDAKTTVQLVFTVLEGTGQQQVFATPIGIEFPSTFSNYPVPESSVHTITVVNNGSSTIYLQQPVSQIAKLGALSSTTLQPGGRVSFTAAPRNDLQSIYQENEYLRETLKIRNTSGIEVTSVELSYFFNSIAHTITFQHGENYTLIDDYTYDQKENQLCIHGGSIGFGVEIRDHYKPGPNYRVMANDKVLSRNTSGWYDLYDVSEDVVIKVEDIVPRPFSYPEDETHEEDNALCGRLDNANDDLFGDLLTRKEEELIDQGYPYLVWLEVEDAAFTTSTMEKHLIDTVKGDGLITHYLDIKLFKQIGQGQNAIKEIIENPGGDVTITIEIPQGHRGDPLLAQRRFGIIRVHDGKPEKLTASYDPDNGLLTFKTDGFSTYAVFFEEAAPAAAAAGNVPTTGDKAVPMLYLGLMMTSLLAVATARRKMRRS